MRERWGIRVPASRDRETGLPPAVECLSGGFKRGLLAALTTPDEHLGWVPFAVAGGLRAARRRPVDVILVSSPPYSAQLAGLVLARVLRKPLVADFRDLWTMNEYADEFWPGAGAARWNARLERMVIRAASCVIANTPTAEAMFRQGYPWAAGKLTTIPNGFDPAEVEGVVPRRFPKFTLTHAGSFYRDRNPRCFLEGLVQWLSRDRHDGLRDDVQVLFIGRNDPSVSHLVSALGLEEVVTLAPSVPPSELYPILAGSDVLLLMLGFRPTSRYVIPAKLYDYLAVGRPVLAFAPEGEVSSLLSDRGVHSVLPRDDPAAVATILESLYVERRQSRSGVGGAALGVEAWPQFWRPHLAQRLRDVLASTVGVSVDLPTRAVRNLPAPAPGTIDPGRSGA